MKSQARRTRRRLLGCLLAAIALVALQPPLTAWWHVRLTEWARNRVIRAEIAGADNPRFRWWERYAESSGSQDWVLTPLDRSPWVQRELEVRKTTGFLRLVWHSPDPFDPSWSRATTIEGPIEPRLGWGYLSRGHGEIFNIRPDLRWSAEARRRLVFRGVDRDRYERLFFDEHPIAEVAAGWPLFFAFGSTRQAPNAATEPDQDLIAETAWWRGSLDPVLGRRMVFWLDRYEDQLVIPYGVKWAPMIANVLFFWTLLALPVLFGVWRRRRRRRRGLCMKCAHRLDPANSGRCPECGLEQPTPGTTPSRATSTA